MAFSSDAGNYRNFRLRRINREAYRHFGLLLFWPAYLMRYVIIEHLNPAARYYPIHCAADDAIPFHEIFLIPYVLWYFFIIGMHLYTLFYDVGVFRAFTKFMIISLSISTAIFLLFPSCQNLRPEVFPRDNLLTRGVQLLYKADTNTNVFPSEHVIGSLAVWTAAAHTERLRASWKIAAIGLFSILVCYSAVALKQHSLPDVAAALPICAIAYRICYKNSAKKGTC